MVMIFPKEYVEIDGTKIAGRIPHRRRHTFSTREKFRMRRLERKMRKMLMENFAGQPLNNDTRDAVKVAIIKHFGHWKL